MIRAGSERHARVNGDSGFGIVEVLVSMVILSVLALALLGTLLTIQKTGFENRTRTAAASYASAQMDSIRLKHENGDPIGPGSAAKVVGGVRFTSSWTVTKEEVPSGPVRDCSATSAGRDLVSSQVQVTVDWEGRGRVDPVVLDTSIVPRPTRDPNAPSQLRVFVRNAADEPVGGARVVASRGGTVLTGTNNGCATYPELARGSITVDISKAGYVNPNWSPTSTQTLTLSGGTTTVLTFFLDRPATVRVTEDADPAFPVPLRMKPADFPLTDTPETVTTIDNGHYTLANPAMSQGSNFVARDLRPYKTTDIETYPFQSGYQVYGGRCANPAPDGEGVPSIDVSPGGTSNVTVSYRPITIRVLKEGTDGVYRPPGGTVSAIIVTEQLVGCVQDGYFLGARGPADGTTRTFQASLHGGTYTPIVRVRDAAGLSDPITLAPFTINSSPGANQVVDVRIPR